MVLLMMGGESGSRIEKISAVKKELEDSLEEEHGPLHKRPRSVGLCDFTVPPAQYNPLDEPSPLGLRLKKSPSLLELIQMKLSQSAEVKVGSQCHIKKESKSGAASGDKLKASNFPASILKIGSWEYNSRYEGDLVAKCYFAKHKLVWEVLDGGLKNKIEIQWSDIMALKANYPEDGPGTLVVVLARQPLFFRETNPQPRKHTLWQATSDFTDGEASIHRRHYLECPQGLLGKHFEKLVQCDPRLNYLSQQGEQTLDSLYFEPKIQVFNDPDGTKNEFDLNREGSPSFFSLQDSLSPLGAQSSSSKNDMDAVSRTAESFTHETPSPSSARVSLTVEDIRNGGVEQLKELSNWDQIMVPGLRSSMSMSDLVNHLEHRISAQGTSINPNLSNEEWASLQILDDIKGYLFSDFQNMPESGDKLLMSRVNSLCCLLQKDTAAGPSIPMKSEYFPTQSSEPKQEDESDNFGASTADKNDGILTHVFEGTSNLNQTLSMPRKDSVGDLLLNLPRIASLPQFLFNISEDFESQAR